MNHFGKKVKNENDRKFHVENVSPHEVYQAQRPGRRGMGSSDD